MEQAKKIKIYKLQGDQNSNWMEKIQAVGSIAYQ